MADPEILRSRDPNVSTVGVRTVTGVGMQMLKLKLKYS
jgi:hypothetical protein